MMHQLVESEQQPILLSQIEFMGDLWLVKFWFPYDEFWAIMCNEHWANDGLADFCYQFRQYVDIADWDYNNQTIEFWFMV